MGGVVVVTFDENEEEKAIFRAYTLRGREFVPYPLCFAYCTVTVLFSYLYHKFINSFRVFCLCYQLVPQREK